MVLGAALCLWHAPALGLEWPGKEEELQVKLRSAVARERLEALRALSKLPEARFRPHLLKAMADSSVTVRSEAARLAASLGVAAAFPVFKEWLKHWDVRRRVLAAESLGAMGSRSAVRTLVRALEDPEQQVRHAVVRALGELKTADGYEVPPLLRRLEDATSAVRKQTVLVLARKKDRRAVIPLMALLRDAHSDVRREAALALGGLGDAGAGPVLVQALDDSSASVVSAAIEALSTLGHRPAVEPLIDLFHNGPTGHRDPAGRALATLGGDLALESLVRALANPSLMEPAQRALISAGAAASGQVVRLLSDPRTPRSVALAAVHVAAEAKLQAAQAPIIAHLRAGRLSPVRLVASLGAIGHSDAQRPLIELLASPHSELRLAALSALDKIADLRAASALSALLGDDDPRIQLGALGLLGRMRARSATPQVARLALSKDPNLARAAVASLVKLRDAASAPTLLRLLGHETPAVRRMASQALINGAGTPALEQKLRARCGALRLTIVSACLQSLGGVLRGKPGHKQTRTFLLGLLSSPVPAASLAALDALAVMNHPRITRLLIKRYPDLEGEAQRRALDALAASGHHRKPSARLLRQALSASLPATRAAAVLALGHHGGADAAKLLRKATRDPHWSVQVNAAAALVRHSTAALADDLHSLAASRIPMVRANALLALGRQPHDPARSRPVLLRALRRDRYPWARLNALRGLLAVGFSSARLPGSDAPIGDAEGLLKAVASTDRDQRVRAICREMIKRRAARRQGGAPATRSRTESWLGLHLLDHQRGALRSAPFILVDPDGVVRVLQSNSLGEAWIEGLPPGRSHVEAPVASALPSP